MYINKPILRLSLSPKRKNPKTTKSLPMRGNQKNAIKVHMMAQAEESSELDNIALLFQIQKKVDRLTGVVSAELDHLANVEIDIITQKDLAQSQKSINISTRQCIQKQLEIFKHNQAQKKKLDNRINRNLISLSTTNKIISQLKQDLERNQKQVTRSTQKANLVCQIQKQFDKSLSQRTKLINIYRKSQQQCQDLKRNVFEMDSNIFLTMEQVQEQIQQTDLYQANLANIAKKNELQSYKRMLCDNNKKDRKCFENLLRQRIEQIVILQSNILTIDDLMTKMHKKLNKQKRFIQTKTESANSIDQGLDQESHELKERLREYYQNLYQLPPLNSLYPRYKSSLNQYYIDQQKNGISSNKRAHTLVSRIKTTTASPHLRMFNSLSLKQACPKKTKARTQNTRHQKAFQDELKCNYENSNENTILKPMRESYDLRKTKQIIQLQQLYKNKNDSLKAKIVSCIKNQKKSFSINKNNEKKQTLELISVNNSEVNSSYDYIEVQLSKNDLVAPDNCNPYQFY